MTSNGAGVRVLVLAQDPGFGGGARRAADLAIAALTQAGLEPTLAFVATVSGPRLSIIRPAVPRRLVTRTSVRQYSIAAILPELQLVQYWVGRQLLRRLNLDNFDWCLVVGGSILHGLLIDGTNLRSAVWLATLVEPELRTRRRSLGPVQRVVHRVLAPLIAAAESRVIGNAQSVLAMSETTAASVQQRGFARPEVIYPAVALTPIAIQPGSRAARLSDRRLEVLFVGRTNDERKRFDVAVAVVGRLKRALPGWQVRFVTTSPSVPVPTGVEHVALGTPDDQQLAAAYASAHVLLLTSDQEGFGIVVAEALLHGVCVATTPSGGPEHVINESGAGFVAEASALPQLIAQLAQDIPRWEQMSLSARRYAQDNFTISVLSQRLLHVFEAIPDGAPGGDQPSESPEGLNDVERTIEGTP